MSVFGALFEPALFTIRRYGVGPKDPLGKPTRVLLFEDTVDGLLSPTGSAEGEAFVVNKFRATVALDVDLRAADEISARGLVYTVEGTPFPAVVPRSNIGVLTAVLQYVGPVTS